MEDMIFASVVAHGLYHEAHLTFSFDLRLTPNKTNCHWKETSNWALRLVATPIVPELL
jgi:hypothetical protein